jgi:hypothetical protein
VNDPENNPALPVIGLTTVDAAINDEMLAGLFAYSVLLRRYLNLSCPNTKSNVSKSILFDMICKLDPPVGIPDVPSAPTIVLY